MCDQYTSKNATATQLAKRVFEILKDATSTEEFETRFDRAYETAAGQYHLSALQTTNLLRRTKKLAREKMLEERSKKESTQASYFRKFRRLTREESTLLASLC